MVGGWGVRVVALVAWLCLLFWVSGRFILGNAEPVLAVVSALLVGGREPLVGSGGAARPGSCRKRVGVRRRCSVCAEADGATPPATATEATAPTKMACALRRFIGVLLRPGV